jgi:hypothetical protein
MLAYVIVICEGQTEEKFIKTVLAPALRPLGVWLKPELLTVPGAKQGGGGVNLTRFRAHARNALRSGRGDRYVTSLLDLYALGHDFPDFKPALEEADVYRRVAALESALHAHIVAYTECRPDRFIPYIQPYEYEGLLFSDVRALAGVEANWIAALKKLREIREAFETPEHINDSPLTAPSKRLRAAVSNPGYRKTLHGPQAAQAIGLATIMRQCRHFRGWVEKLRALSSEFRPPEI